MDPWARFEHALKSEADPSEELFLLLSELDMSRGVAPADRQELKASAMAVLAEKGAVPFQVALGECRLAWAMGRTAWPSLYLAWAALACGDANTALECVERVPRGYFDEQDLHWRTVQLHEIAAEAHLLLGQHAAAARLVETLNREYREESDEEFLMAPVSLVRGLLRSGPPFDLLRTLVRGLELDDWFSPDIESVISAAIA